MEIVIDVNLAEDGHHLFYQKYSWKNNSLFLSFFYIYLYFWKA